MPYYCPKTIRDQRPLTSRQSGANSDYNDNTIIYDSNRYSVLLGTYNTSLKVRLEIANGNLLILTVFGICSVNTESVPQGVCSSGTSAICVTRLSPLAISKTVWRSSWTTAQQSSCSGSGRKNPGMLGHGFHCLVN